MKTTTGTPPKVFAPITIIIETKAEAEAMWHRLNTPNTYVQGSSNPDLMRILNYIDVDMWASFDDQYTPESRY